MRAYLRGMRVALVAVASLVLGLIVGTSFRFMRLWGGDANAIFIVLMILAYLGIQKHEKRLIAAFILACVLGFTIGQGFFSLSYWRR